MGHTVGTRELCNDTAALLRRVRAGEEVTATVHGEPVAVLVPFRQPARRWMPRDEAVALLESSRADAGLRDDLAALGREMTDELGAIE